MKNLPRLAGGREIFIVYHFAVATKVVNTLKENFCVFSAGSKIFILLLENH
jgi:hypothetical protein